MSKILKYVICLLLSITTLVVFFLVLYGLTELDAWVGKRQKKHKEKRWKEKGISTYILKKREDLRTTIGVIFCVAFVIFGIAAAWFDWIFGG